MRAMIQFLQQFYQKSQGRNSMKTQILFVDDERWGVDPYFKELMKNDFECVLAKNGDEAIKKLKNQKFALLSMDIMFPPGRALGQDTKPIKAGVQLLEMIRQGKIENCNSGIKVIVLTAVINYEIENEIKKLGVSAYLKKPIEFPKVIETFIKIRDELKKDR